MSFRIIIAGESQCEKYAEVCLIADYLSQNLPIFCYERIEQPVIKWQAWLNKVNSNYNWHHTTSPLIWKELLLKGSKPHYIGGTSEFMEYCHSYYKFDSFINTKKWDDLKKNNIQFKKRLAKWEESKGDVSEFVHKSVKDSFVVSVTGSDTILMTNLINGLLDMCVTDKSISKVYIYNSEKEIRKFENIEFDCCYVGTKHPHKIVKSVSKLGIGLTNSDLLIILDHVPFNEDSTIGMWLEENKNAMVFLSEMINASGPPGLRILLPNLGPSCYNATILMKSLKSINKNNIVVATSDLGLEIISEVAQILKISAENIYCPPVWGFVGINHLVDVRTTIHRYNTFYPYERYKKVNNSTLKIGYLTPEMRTLEYLMYRDDKLWVNIAERKIKSKGNVNLNKITALLNVVKKWLFGPEPNDIINLGILCNGSFGLTFDGIFSQPAQLRDGIWKPAPQFMLPRDPQMKIQYLEYVANLAFQYQMKDLPKITIHCPPYRRPVFRLSIIKKPDIRFVE